MRNLTFAFLSTLAGGAAAYGTACSSSSSSAGAADSGADCAITSTVVYDCAPLRASDFVDGGLADGGAFCRAAPRSPTSDAGVDSNVYPLGCGATLPQYSAATDTQTGCNGPITCTCQINGSSASFVCPD